MCESKNECIRGIGEAAEGTERQMLEREMVWLVVSVFFADDSLIPGSCLSPADRKAQFG